MCRKFLCLALGVVFLNLGCDGSTSGSTDYDAETYESPDSGRETPDSGGSDVAVTVVTFSGTVVDVATSLPLSGVTVKAPGASPATTDESGNFTLEGVPGAEWALVATKAGYATAVKRVVVPADGPAGLAFATRLSMMAVGATALIDPAQGGTVSEVGGAQVTFPPNSFVTRDGAPVTGQVTVTITPLNPFDPVEVQAFPGSFEAINAQGESGLLQSYSVMDITATAGGVELTLAEGKRATVIFPLQKDVDAPETLGLWSLDTTTGVWKDEGTATRRAVEGKRYYEAEIPHLSYWNCDWFNGQTVEIKANIVTVDSGLDTALNTEMTWWATGKSYINVGTSSGCGSDRQFVARMPANDFVALQIFGMAGSTRVGFSSNAIFVLTPASGTVTLADIKVVPDTCSLTTVSGTPSCTALTTCNGSCMEVPYYCMPGLDPKHPCATNSGGCLNGRQCVEAPSLGATVATQWSCGDCPGKRAPLGLLDCQPVTCAVSRGFCDDHATCANVAAVAVCTCTGGYFGEGHSCSAWANCGAGQHVAAAGTATTNRTCTACDLGTFSTGTNAAACTAWGSCGVGQYVAAPGTASADRGCATCGTGTFSTTANAQSCTAWTNCGAGQHVAASGTALADRTCTSCDSGTFSTTANAAGCTPWSECSLTQHEAQAGTSTKDRACVECDAGYQGDGTACVPGCLAMPCGMNATCTAPNVCTCDTGYSGNGHDCTGTSMTSIDISAGLVGNDAWNWASIDSVRGLEFYIGKQVNLVGVTVSGLPPDKAGTAQMWIKTGAVNLQVADTFSLGTPYSLTSTTSATATFLLPTPKQIGFSTYSIVVSVADTDAGFQWQLQQIYNNSPSVTVDSMTIESVWGWHGNVNTQTNTATDVAIYDNYMIQIPRVTLDLSN